MYIDHVGINTNDMEATLQFYCGILGMRRLIPLSQVDQYLGLAGQIQNGAGFEFFGS